MASILVHTQRTQHTYAHNSYLVISFISPHTVLTNIDITHSCLLFGYSPKLSDRLSGQTIEPRFTRSFAYASRGRKIAQSYKSQASGRIIFSIVSIGFGFFLSRTVLNQSQNRARVGVSVCVTSQSQSQISRCVVVFLFRLNLIDLL